MRRTLVRDSVPFLMVAYSLGVRGRCEALRYADAGANGGPIVPGDMFAATACGLLAGSDGWEIEERAWLPALAGLQAGIGGGWLGRVVFVTDRWGFAFGVAVGEFSRVARGVILFSVGDLG